MSTCKATAQLLLFFIEIYQFIPLIFNEIILYIDNKLILISKNTKNKNKLTKI